MTVESLPSAREAIKAMGLDLRAGLIIGFILFIITIVIWAFHRSLLLKCAGTHRRDLYLSINQLPFVIALTSLLTLWIPRTEPLNRIGFAIAEARVLAHFGVLLVNFVAGTLAVLYHFPADSKFQTRFFGAKRIPFWKTHSQSSKIFRSKLLNSFFSCGLTTSDRGQRA